MPTRSRTLGLLVLIALGGCASSAALPTPAPPVDAAPAAAPTPAPIESVTLRYSDQPLHFEQQTTIELSVDGDTQRAAQHRLDFVAQVERSPMASGTLLEWSLDTVGIADVPDSTDALDGRSGSLQIDSQGTRIGGIWNEDLAGSLLRTGSLWPMLPDTTLRPGEGHTTQQMHQLDIGGVEVPVHASVTYALTEVDPERGIAVVQIEGRALGEAQHDGHPLKVEQSTDTTLVLGLAEGLPRRWTTTTEQRYAFDGHTRTLAQSVESTLVPHQS